MDILLHALVENSADAITMLNADGTVRFASSSSTRLIGYSADERIGRNGFELMHPEDAPRMKAAFAECLSKPGVPIAAEFRIRHKDGSFRHIESIAVNRLGEPAIAAVVINYRDVTERRLSDERLRKSEARYRSLIEGAAYGIYQSTRDGTILAANPALAQMLGYASVDELLTRNMRDFYQTPSDRGELIERFGNQPAAEVDLKWKRKDGTPILVHLTARAVDIEDGVSGFEGIAEDITHKRTVEEHLRQSQKMEAVGRLARGVAHDFNNVLAAILGCCDLLWIKLKDGDPARDEAEEIRNAAERGVALTRQLLAFSRSGAMEADVFDLNIVVGEFHSMLQRLTADIELRVHTPIRPTPVSIERGQLQQVLLNLVVNARDAMPSGGAIDIGIDTVTIGADRSPEYPALTAGRYARIRVRDTGTGIDPALHAHIFEPFFTTKAASKGTGLGLSIVYGIVKECGGTVVFTSTPNLGTTFDVLLPSTAGA